MMPINSQLTNSIEFLIMQTQSKPENTLLKTCKSIVAKINKNNYMMVYSAQIDLTYATILYIIRQLQVISILALPPSETNQPHLKVYGRVFRICEYASLKFEVAPHNQQILEIIVSAVLLVCQIAFLTIMFISSSKEQTNRLFSRIVTVIAILTPIPIVLQLTGSLSKLQQTGGIEVLSISAVTFILLLFNQFLYCNYHYCFSIKLSFRNVLARFPRSILYQYLWILIAALYQLVLNQAFPTMFIIYNVFILIVSVFEAKGYAIGIEYFQPKMSRNIGIMHLLTITFCIANLSLYLNVTLVKYSIVTFVIFFFLFFSNFFLTFQKFWLKRIIIDDITNTEPTQITYALTYIIFFCKIADKKNETYLSSLLKNHCNNCSKMGCCCKHRDKNYDPAKKKHGDSTIQPHLDNVFIKHFLLSVIKDSIEEFPKSCNLKLFIALFYLQFLELPFEIVQSIRYFYKKSVMDKLTISQGFSIFCLQRQFNTLIKKKNQKEGNLKCEEAQIFDQYLRTTREKVNCVIGNLQHFWAQLQRIACINSSNQIDQTFLKNISDQTLGYMREIIKNYDKMKGINIVSTELRELMLIYSKEVAHDIDFFNCVKEQIKSEKLTKRSVNLCKINQINIYSSDTCNMVIEDIQTIKWVSTNAPSIFGYQNRTQMLKLKVNALMPVQFGKGHASKVKKWEQTGLCLKMNNCINIWCMAQNGSCFKCLIYMKVMPNPNWRDIQYYVSLERVGKNQVICGPDGEIYGCDNALKSIIGYPLKSFQNYRIYIQLFFPLAFQHFFEYFFKDYKEKRKKQESKYSSYIPSNLAEYIQKSHKDIDNLEKKYVKTKNYNFTLLQYLQNKMQEITTEVNGRYVTSYFQFQKHDLMGRKLVIIKVSKEDQESVQLYYDQLQLCIKMINNLRETIKNKKQQQSINKKIQSHSIMNNPFNIFTNPRKLKLMLENGEKYKSTRKFGNLSLKQKKQRALNRLVEIKNPVVRQNFHRMKVALLRNRIISNNLYNILTRQKGQNDEESMSQYSQSLNLKECNDDKGSDDQLLNYSLNQESQDHESEQKVSFQESAASSAAFISMSTKIRILKNKLKQIKAPFLLRLTHGLFIMVLIILVMYRGSKLIIDHHSCSQYEITNKFDISVIETFNQLSLARIIQSQLNLHQQFKSQQLGILKKHFTAGAIQKMSKNFAQDPQIKKTWSKWDYSRFDGMSLIQIYLEEYLKIQRNLEGWDYSINHRLLEEVQERYMSNTVRIVDGIYELISFITLCVVLLILILLNIYHSKLKINEMATLLSKLYPHERKKYLDHFNRLPKMLKEFNLQTSYHQMNARSPFRNRKSNSQLVSVEQQRQNLSIRFLIVFFLLVSFSVTNYFVVDSHVRLLQEHQDMFDRIFFGKLDLSHSVFLLQMQNYQTSSEEQIRRSIAAYNETIVPLYVQLYNSNFITETLKQKINEFSTHNVCQQLPTLTQICQNVNNGTFTHGIFNSYYYIEEVTKYYSKRELGDREGQNITTLILTQSINSILTFQMVQQLRKQQIRYFKQLAKIDLVLYTVLIGMTIVCLFLEYRVYRELSELFSKYNTILQMIPFDVLVQNPYIKLYLKHEFGIRSLSY